MQVFEDDILVINYAGICRRYINYNLLLICKAYHVFEDEKLFKHSLS